MKFEEYKKQNDLNTFFAKNLDDHTREKILRDIEDLLMSDSSKYIN
jgi:hypothetical protein